MIICFSEKINSFYKNKLNNCELTQEDVQKLMPCCEDINCKCPKCGAKCNFAYHGSYMRNVSIIQNNKRYDFKVRVTRVICKSCNSTHALIPDFIVPYKIYSRESILGLVEESATCPITKLSNQAEATIQLIYSFIHLVLSFFNQADSLNREQNWHKNFNEEYFISNCVEICNEKFNIKFFKRYKWIFLMTKFQNTTSPPIHIGVNLIAST